MSDSIAHYPWQATPEDCSKLTEIVNKAFPNYAGQRST